MFDALIIGAVMISAQVVFHVMALVYLSDTLKKRYLRKADTGGMPRIMLYMVFVVTYFIGVHTIEAWGWAALYLHLDEFADMERALYFSVVTATTLGYGDITLTPKWQLLSTFEAMGGLILFGVTTAFLLEVMRHLFKGPG